MIPPSPSLVCSDWAERRPSGPLISTGKLKTTQCSPDFPRSIRIVAYQNERSSKSGTPDHSSGGEMSTIAGKSLRDGRTVVKSRASELYLQLIGTLGRQRIRMTTARGGRRKQKKGNCALDTWDRS